MNANRILKEARPLFWPWCAVVLAAMLPLFRSLGSIAWIGGWGFILGTPVLATLSLGSEFQYHTLPLLLSQPVNRMEIWREKLFVTTVAVLSAALVFFLTSRGSGFQLGWHTPVLGAALIASTIAAAAFWTLFSRSTVGGIVLNIAIPSLILYAVNMTSWLRKPTPAAPANVAVNSAVCLFIYAGVMLWMGRRALTRFQAVGSAAGDDLLTSGPSMMPRALAVWLRCRPKGAALNLIRKEICMLRLVWLISLLAAVCWACLALLRLRLVQDSAKSFQIVVISVAVVCTLMISILAGCLSLGEEKTSGTHAWQLTLPVSPFLQWGIKLCTALFAGFVGAWLLPLLIMGMFLYGPSRVFVNPPFGIGVLLMVLLLTFAAFWCACAVDGTVAAVLWVVPVLCVVGGAGYFAQELANAIVNPFWGPKPSQYLGSDPWLVFVSQSHHVLNLFGNLRFDWWAASLTFRHIQVLGLLENPLLYAAIPGVPAVILALVQSYRMFRTRTSTGARLALRKLLPLVLLVFLCGFIFTAFDAFWWRASMQMNHFNAVTGNAIEQNLQAAVKMHPSQPLQLTLDDVAKSWRWPLEDSTRRWLTGATITITPDKAHPAGFFCTPDPYGHAQCYYSATIHLANGTDIFETYDPPTGSKFRWGPHSVSILWPGAKVREPLWDR
jgi:hypothetical protein